MRSVLTRVFILGLASAMLLCCNQTSSETMSVLRHADDIIEDLPDSAYAMLQRIDATTLAGGEEQAYYSLLMSMAIDKQYIDLTADSVIAPAAKYYRHHGSNDDKMRTAYYHARILENAGDEEGAMKLLVDNLKLARKSQYHLFKGRYYIKIAALYNNNYDFEHAYNYAKEAKNEYHLSGRVKNYVTGLLTTSTYLQQLKEFRAAEAELDTVKMHWNQINDLRKGEYYRQRINIEILSKVGNGASFRDECIKENLKEADIPYAMISYSYLQEGRIIEAKGALNKYASLHPDKTNTQHFQYLLATLHIASNDYTNALEAERIYRAIGEHDQLRIINSDTRFIEERYRLMLETEKKKELLIAVTGGFIIILLIILLLHLRHKERTAQFRHRYDALISERDSLKAILDNGIVMDEEHLSMIKQRLDDLNRILLGKTTGIKELMTDEDNDIFKDEEGNSWLIMATSLLFSYSHPEIMQALKEKGLSERECGICCLYIMGLSGKQIENTILKGSGYRVSASLRKKFGLDSHDTNLSIYLRHMVETLKDRQ